MADRTKKRVRKLTDEEILTRVQAKVSSSTQWPGSKLSEENERVIRYYNSELPARRHKGSSSYVSSDVYDAVEQMKCQMLETFGGDRELVKFDPYDPRNPQDVFQARIETTACHNAIFSDNDGFGLIHDVVHDGLTARKGVAHVYWEEDYAYDTVEFDDLSLDDVQALAAQDDISDMEAELSDDADEADPMTWTYQGKYMRKIDRCRVCIEPVPPEEYFVQQRVKRRQDGIRGRRRLVTRADLIEDGYPRDKVEQVNWEDDTSIDLSPEKQARDKPSDSGATLGMGDVQDELRGVLLYEAWCDLSLYGDGKKQLYRIVYAGSVLFELDEVDEDPFIEFDALRVPHTAWGNNFGARVIQTQNARTVLTRGILDHTATTTNPRWAVVQGGLVNPKEMIDNRLGGLVNTTRPDAIQPMLQPNLNPFVFQTIEMLKQNKEENTGISALSQGLNKDAISTQNSQGLVEGLVSLSQIRQKVMARFFARSFLAPLYLRVWKLLAEYEKKDKFVELAPGAAQATNPQAWQQPRKISLSYHLGYGELEKEAALYLSFYKEAQADPLSKQYMGPKQAYTLLTDAVSKNGIRNFSDYILPPEQWQPSQPDPIEMGKVKAMQDTAQAALITAQSNSRRADVAEHHEALRTQNDTEKTQSTVAKQAADTERQNLETVSRVDVAQREIELAEKLPATSQKAVYAPNV